MAIVHYRARGPNGEPVHSQVDAESLEEAAQKIAPRQLTEVVWETGPIVPDLDGDAAAGKALVPNPTSAGKVVLRSFLSNWPLWAVVIYVDATTKRPLLGAALTAVAITFWGAIALPVAVYRRLQIDKAWSRWDDVFRALKFLRLCNLVVRKKTLAFAYDLEEARALAGTGRLEEGLALFAKHEGKTPAERGRFAGMLVGLYDGAQRYDEALASAERFTQACPDDPSAWIDLAMRYALRSHDPVRAREVLHRAEGRVLAEIGVVFRHVVLGVILVEEGSFGAALVELDAAMKDLEKREITPGLRELGRIHRAWALAGVGRAEEARREFATARPMFLAAKQFSLVVRIESAILDARPSGEAV